MAAVAALANVALPATDVVAYLGTPPGHGALIASVGHFRPRRMGRWPLRLSMASAMRASGLAKPKAMRVIKRILVLTASMSPLEEEPREPDHPTAGATRLDRES